MANGNFRIRLLDEPEQNSQDSDNTPAQDGVRPSGHRFSASERNSSTSRDVGWAENSNQSLMSKAPTMTNSEPDNSRADSAPPRSRSYAGGRSRSFKILDDPCMTQPFACSSLLDSDRQPPESNHDRPASLPAKPPQTPGVPQTPTDDSIRINADSSLTLGGSTASDAPRRNEKQLITPSSTNGARRGAPSAGSARRRAGVSGASGMTPVARPWRDQPQSARFPQPRPRPAAADRPGGW